MLHGNRTESCSKVTGAAGAVHLAAYIQTMHWFDQVWVSCQQACLFWSSAKGSPLCWLPAICCQHCPSAPSVHTSPCVEPCTVLANEERGQGCGSVQAMTAQEQLHTVACRSVWCRSGQVACIVCPQHPAVATACICSTPSPALHVYVHSPCLLGPPQMQQPRTQHVVQLSGAATCNTLQGSTYACCG